MELTPIRRPRRRERDAAAFLGMVRRMLRAAARRVGDGDEPELADLVSMRDDVDAALALAVELQRDRGKSWTQIAAGLGTSKQGAQQWYERRRTA